MKADDTSTVGTPTSLVYWHSDGISYSRVDATAPFQGVDVTENPTARRERAILRALLGHALFLLGPEEGEW